MNQPVIVRTPFLIAAEINSIKEQTRKMLLANSIEIGRRLVEAKSVVEHGQWTKWLEESVEYSPRTANNLMRIFEEYGSNQTALFGYNANSQALADLSYTQAVALLGIPSEEREQFVEEHELDNMSTRELQQAIRERDEAKQESERLKGKLEAATKNATEAFEANDKLINDKNEAERQARLSDQVLRETQETVKMLQESLKKQREESKAEVERLFALLEDARNNGSSAEKVKELEAQLQEARDKVDLLTTEINKPVEPKVVEKVPEEIERELEALRVKTQELEAKAGQQPDETLVNFRVYFDILVKGFADLLGALTKIEDREARENYKGAVIKLIGKMQERL